MNRSMRNSNTFILVDKKDITISKLHGKIKLGYQRFVFQKPVKNGERWACVHKNLYNGSITTDNDLKHSHNHETNPGVLEAERAIYKMKQDAKENLIFHLKCMLKMQQIYLKKFLLHNYV
ncbi:FLYWCH-type domain-containing protein [Aphis craccivora]|uniref:FLYWCH-type domain-containing protein n=1 Tax=Aphis craccivora TaxID=307492 RepID=A0A6G0X6D0_APHCR|nr:FLYWCH-type domain-containing protein [Aphis craccivora]